MYIYKCQYNRLSVGPDNRTTRSHPHRIRKVIIYSS